MTEKSRADTQPVPPPLVQAADSDLNPTNPAQDAMWIEVIRKMDETYADLVRYQVELEEKNSALEEAQHFIASVLASMTDVLIVCDVQGRVQQVNPALETLTGLSESELLGKPFQSLLTADCLSLANSFAEKIRRGAIHDCEVTLRAPNGDTPLAMNCSSRFDHRGRLVGMVLIGRPVGELRTAYEDLNLAHAELQQAQQQLISSEKMASLGRLVAGVAHELNNPISFVYGNIHALVRYRERLARYLSALESRGVTSDIQELKEELRIEHILADLEPLLKGTLEGAERVRDVVQDLRRFSSGKQGERTEFDLAHVAGTAVHWVTKGARQRLHVQLDLPESLTVKGHPGQIHQVVMNLVQNALDAVQHVDEPRIRVSAGGRESIVWLLVQDNGPGVADENRTRLFDPFFTTKPVGQGIGLGLSISYGIVTDHGGTLTVENASGGGAIFRVELPQA